MTIFTVHWLMHGVHCIILYSIYSPLNLSIVVCAQFAFFFLLHLRCRCRCRFYFFSFQSINVINLNITVETAYSVCAVCQEHRECRAGTWRTHMYNKWRQQQPHLRLTYAPPSYETPIAPNKYKICILYSRDSRWLNRIGEKRDRALLLWEVPSRRWKAFYLHRTKCCCRTLTLRRHLEAFGGGIFATLQSVKQTRENGTACSDYNTWRAVELKILIYSLIKRENTIFNLHWKSIGRGELRDGICSAAYLASIWHIYAWMT